MMNIPKAKFAESYPHAPYADGPSAASNLIEIWFCIKILLFFLNDLNYDFPNYMIWLNDRQDSMGYYWTWIDC